MRNQANRTNRNISALADSLKLNKVLQDSCANKFAMQLFFPVGNMAIDEAGIMDIPQQHH